jgi:hypothetical protein
LASFRRHFAERGRRSTSPAPRPRAERFSLNGFGKFKVKDQPAREGRNPSTGALIPIAAPKKLAFTPAKDQLNG